MAKWLLRTAAPEEEKKEEEKKEKKVVGPTFKELKTHPKAPTNVPNIPSEQVPVADDAIKALIEKYESVKINVLDIEADVLKRKKEIEGKAAYAERRVELKSLLDSLFASLKEVKEQQVRMGEKIYMAEDVIQKTPLTLTLQEKIEKLYKKYGEEAEKFITRSEAQLGSIDEETLRVLTKPVKPGLTSSLRVKANLITYVKSLYQAATTFLGDLFSCEADLDDILNEIQ